MNQPPEPPPQWPQQPQPQVVYAEPYIVPQTCGHATASLICGIVGVFGCCCCPAFAASVAAVILGHVALSRINSNAYLSGREMAIVGLCLGYIPLLVYVLMLITSLSNPDFYKQLQDNIDKAKQQIQHAEKDENRFPSDAT